VSALLVERRLIGDCREESEFTISVKLENSAVEVCAMHCEEYGMEAARKF